MKYRVLIEQDEDGMFVALTAGIAVTLRNKKSA